MSVSYKVAFFVFFPPVCLYMFDQDKAGFMNTEEVKSLMNVSNFFLFGMRRSDTTNIIFDRTLFSVDFAQCRGSGNSSRKRKDIVGSYSGEPRNMKLNSGLSVDKLLVETLQ